MPCSISHLFFRKRRMCFTDFCLLFVSQISIFSWQQDSRSLSQYTCGFASSKWKRKVISLCSLSLLHSAACLLSCVEPARFYTLQTMLKNSPYLSSLWKKKFSLFSLKLICFHWFFFPHTIPLVLLIILV